MFTCLTASCRRRPQLRKWLLLLLQPPPPLLLLLQAAAAVHHHQMYSTCWRVEHMRCGGTLTCSPRLQKCMACLVRLLGLQLVHSWLQLLQRRRQQQLLLLMMLMLILRMLMMQRQWCSSLQVPPMMAVAVTSFSQLLLALWVQGAHRQVMAGCRLCHITPLVDAVEAAPLQRCHASSSSSSSSSSMLSVVGGRLRSYPWLPRSHRRAVRACLQARIHGSSSSVPLQ